MRLLCATLCSVLVPQRQGHDRDPGQQLELTGIERGHHLVAAQEEQLLLFQVVRVPLGHLVRAEEIAGAKVVYTDVWASMGQEAEAEARRRLFAPFQVTLDLFSFAAPDAIFLHCLPAHRGEEISAEVLERFADVIFDQAENKMHLHQALLAWLLT